MKKVVGGFSIPKSLDLKKSTLRKLRKNAVVNVYECWPSMHETKGKVR